MKNRIFLTLLLTTLSSIANAQIATPSNYLDTVKAKLKAKWPNNRTINLVFHGHSVPAGYGDRHEVNTLTAYPQQLLVGLKQKYPYAVINVIVTAIGGENSISGQERFAGQVLNHQMDVLYIDYALNDRFSDLKQVRKAHEKMIEQALAKGIKVILVTPSPDQRLDIGAADNPMLPYVAQLEELAGKYKIGLADPFTTFKKIAKATGIKTYMESVNHPNSKGHQVIANELLSFFN